MPKGKKYVGPTDEKTIGKRLREARLRRGLMQVQLAETLGIDQSLISEYERGVIRVHGSLLAGLAKTLKASSDEILGLKPQRTNGSSDLDPRFLRRLQQIKKLSKRQKQALLITIDNFLKGAVSPA